MKNQIFSCILFFFFTNIIWAQKYTIDARISNPVNLEGHLKMGNPGPQGQEILVNNKYLTVGGKPTIPVMGELHYSRIPRDKWEDIILKTKANGINIIACYVFWIHHEEVEGKFDWSGNKDLRAFVELCHKHGVWVYPRIGPWCHGEVRNGGLPDWLLKKDNISLRSNQPMYQQYVERLYSEIGKQLQGLYYKDGGPVIGVQLENEYWRGKKGEEHILWLKQTAIKYGMDVPLYTVTGWRSASVPQDEVIPLWGGYPAAPWNTDLLKIKENDSYVFDKPVNDESIGHKESSEKYAPDYSRYPYFTCELGIGNQISDHRRPVIASIDGLAIAAAKTGSGSNLLGYYVFAGGLNPAGIFTTMEEDRLETGYWNEYPDISYDFQAAIRETGEISLAYQKIKILHYFLSEFGSSLAPMTPIIPMNVDSKKDLQYAVRVKENSGFVFGMNYYRGYAKETQKEVQFEIQLKDEKLVFPSRKTDIPDSSIFIWPFHFEMNGITLQYATAQPLCRINNDWFFVQTRGVTPEMAFKSDGIDYIMNKQKISNNDGNSIICNVTPGLDSPLIIRSKQGKEQRVFIIPQELADKVWLLHNKGRKYLFIASSNLYINNESELHAFGLSDKIEITALSPVEFLQIPKDCKVRKKGNFTSYNIIIPPATIPFELKKNKYFEGAQWLKVSTNDYKEKNELFHRLLFKEFRIENPADIRKAEMKIFTDIPCNIRANGKWVNQPVNPGVIGKIDLTGYLKHGLNDLLLDFPYKGGNKSFVAVIETEFYNSDRLKIVTDTSWLTIEQYKIPAPWETTKNLSVSHTVPSSVDFSDSSFSSNSWQITFPEPGFQQFDNVFLRINYAGNKGQARIGQKLTADNFNNGTTWSINLKTCVLDDKNSIQLDLEPLNEDYKIYFDKIPPQDELGKALIQSIRIEPEYRIILKIK